LEYLEFLKGELPSDKTTIFEGIDTSWNRVKGGEAIGDILHKVESDFDFKNPATAIPQLIEAYRLIQHLEDTHWKGIKTEAIKNIITACAGLYLEVVAETNQATRNDLINLKIEAINRSATAVSLVSVGITSLKNELHPNQKLEQNKDYSFDLKVTIPSKKEFSSPYWLSEKGTLGMYKVTDQHLIGNPESNNALTARFVLSFNGNVIDFERPVVYKMNDPVKGEVYKPFEIIPEATAKVAEKVIIFETDKQKEVALIVRSGKDSLEGYVTMAHPKDWSVFPEKQKVFIASKGQEQTLIFTVIPPKNQSEGLMTPMVHVNGEIYTNELVEIDYDHIPFQTILLPSESKVVRLDIQKKGDNIGYIEGAGDTVPESLKQIGYNVVIIKPEDISAELLHRFDAIVVGIRAYNTIEALKYKQQHLFDFVHAGGNLIVQYNTNFRLVVDEIAPYNLKLSRDRVTDENSKVSFLNPEHPLLNYPNKISQKDFEGWTQERGLYFPDQWSDEFTPILSMHDSGEANVDGSLLVAKYGKGYYIYTGLSFFREFPEGVSGAYRLFANMLSIGKETINNTQKLSD
jgi:hypothetical protein